MTGDRDRLIDALRRALPPVRTDGPSRELWPDVRQRVRESPPRIPWLDWAMAAAMLAGVCALPAVLPTLLYLF